MDDILILLLVLLGLAFPVSAIAGLLIALSARRQVRALEQRLALVEGWLRPSAAEDAISPAVEAPPQPEPIEDIVAPPEAEPNLPPTSPVPPIAAAAPQPAAGPGLEEKLGSRWAVWVGGLALALGGVFLVRYSIEQNLLTPAARIAFGGLFALALIGAGEWLRRREQAVSLPGLPAANVPAILTAAGTCTAFAAAYAAYALYGLIGPGPTFVVLGLVAVLAMVAATLHGPALAALGLVGAMGSPLLVSSDRPQPWALAIYLAFVVLPAYGVARLRLWRWLALAAAGGALVWTAPIMVVDSSNLLPAMVHLVVQTAFAAFFLVAAPYRGVPDAEARTDRIASGALLAFTLGAILVSGSVMAGDGRPVFVAAMALILLATGLRFAPGAPAAALAALMAVGALAVWPIRSAIGGDPESLFYLSGDPFAVRPDALGLYLALAVILPAVVAATSLLRLVRGPDLRLPQAAWYAGAATAGPLLALVAAYWRVAGFERSLSFALVAAALALAFVAATTRLNRAETGGPARLALGATAAAALSALALGLTFALDKGMLTVAFALTALGTAWIAERAAIPALRYAVGAIGLIVLGRLAWSPTIVGGDPGPVIVNWLLWGYGIPAAAFYLSARLLRRSGHDRVVQLTEGLSIVFAAFLVFFEIRHALHAGDPLAEDVSLLEAGLLATESLVFALLLTRLDLRRSDPVYRWGAMAFRVASFGLSIGGLLLFENPLLTGDSVSGGVVFNALIPAYLLPSLLAGALAYAERNVRPRGYVMASAVLSLALQWTYVALEIRRIFQGPQLGLWHGFTQGEQWSYSLALLVIGIVLLGIGILRDHRFARLASAVYLVAAVVKVFIVDLANLEGVMRAVSFIGLGLVLIGIGLVYQRLLAQRPNPAAISS